MFNTEYELELINSLRLQITDGALDDERAQVASIGDFVVGLTNRDGDCVAVADLDAAEYSCFYAEVEKLEALIGAKLDMS